MIERRKHGKDVRLLCVAEAAGRERSKRSLPQSIERDGSQETIDPLIGDGGPLVVNYEYHCIACITLPCAALCWGVRCEEGG
jgi:hypothetical protein